MPYIIVYTFIKHARVYLENIYLMEKHETVQTQSNTPLYHSCMYVCMPTVNASSHDVQYNTAICSAPDFGMEGYSFAYFERSLSN